MKQRSAIVAGIALAAGLISGGASWSQQEPSAGVKIRLDDVQPHKRMRKELNRIPQIMEQLREVDVTRPASTSGTTSVAKSGAEEKADLTKELEGAIAERFDADMKTRESDLASLEQRVSKLRTLLERRRKAKPEILQLQLKVLLNQAEGLGFTDFDRGVKNGYRVPESVDSFRRNIGEKR